MADSPCEFSQWNMIGACKYTWSQRKLNLDKENCRVLLEFKMECRDAPTGLSPSNLVFQLTSQVLSVNTHIHSPIVLWLPKNIYFIAIPYGWPLVSMFHRYWSGHRVPTITVSPLTDHKVLRISRRRNEYHNINRSPHIAALRSFSRQGMMFESSAGEPHASNLLAV